MFALAWRYRWGCTRLVALQWAIVSLGLAGLSVTGVAIDTVRSCVSGSATPVWPLGLSPPAQWPALGIVALLAVLVLVLGLARSVLNYVYTVAVARLTQQQIVVDLRAKVYEKLQRMDFRYYAASTSGSLINRVTGDVQNVRTFVDGVLVPMIVLVMSLGVYLAYMLSIHVGLTLLCLATTPILWVLGASFSRTVRPAYDRNRQLVDDMLLTLTENVRGIQVVKGFAREEHQTERFRQSNRAVKDQQQWIFWRVSIFTPTIEFLISLNLVALLAYGGYLVMHEELALGAGLIVFAGLLQNFSTQVTKITNIVNGVQQSLAGAQRVFEILDRPIEIQSPPNGRRLSRGAVPSSSTRSPSSTSRGSRCWKRSASASSPGSTSRCWAGRVRERPRS